MVAGAAGVYHELLAAIPSVIYGLWAIFVLVPLLRTGVEPWLGRVFGMDRAFRRPAFWHRYAGCGNHSSNHGGADHFRHHPRGDDRGAAAAARGRSCSGRHSLGNDSRRRAANARAGIMGGIILGLGRALGETMAVTMVIGNRAEIAKSLFAPGYTMASVLANEFAEASGDLYLSSLIEVGLALFIVTIIVNIIAQFLVWTVTRGTPARGNA